MALEGTLKDFALPDIFQLIGLQKKTGTLLLRDEADEVTIAFKDGSLVSADSKNKRLEGRLGTMLVKSGQISETQLHEVLEKQKQTLQRLGVLLVNEGVVRQDVLKKALDLQITQIIYRVFRWEDAYYHFDQEDQIDYDQENVTPISAESILMEGMRIIDEWPIVEKVVRSMAAVYEKVPVDMPVEIDRPVEFDPDADDDGDEFDFSFGGGGAKDEGSSTPAEEKITLDAEIGAVYELIDGVRPLEDVMYMAKMSDFDTCKAAYDLINRDLIREVEAAGATGGAAGAASSTQTAELNPMFVAVLHLALVVAVGAGIFFNQQVPWAKGIVGLNAGDVRMQQLAAIGSRLDRVANALEAHRLAFQDQAYAANLEDLVDNGLVRREDMENPWGDPFEYTPTEDGFELRAVDANQESPPGLIRTGGMRQPKGAALASTPPAAEKAGTKSKD